MFNKSKKHLTDTDLGYWQHFRYSSGHGMISLKIAWYSILHAIYPGLYPFTAENMLKEQCKLMKKRIDARKKYLKLKEVK